MFLKEHDSVPYRNALLNACFQNISYDRQCEDSRAPYLWNLIQFSKNEDFYREGILEYLRKNIDDPDEYDWLQIFGLARRFVAQGDTEIRHAMYAAFERFGFEKAGCSCAEEFIQLDGFDGFIFVTKQIDLKSLDKDDHWKIHYLIEALEKIIGKDKAEMLLTESTTKNTWLSDLLAAANVYQLEREERRKEYNGRSVPTYSEIQSRQDDTNLATKLRDWGKSATKEQLELAAKDLFEQEDEMSLWAYLRLFYRHPFPGDVNRLLSLTEDNRQKIKGSACQVLSYVHHPAVRARALELMKSQDRFDDGVEMLASNYESGDFKYIEELLRRPMKPEVLHSLGFGIHHILKTNLTPEAENSLLLLYDMNPCSNCREDSVQYLLNLGKLPDWLRTECQYDTNSKTIEITKQR